VPKINNDGQISGCYLMINYNAVMRGAFKITNDEQVLKKEHPEIFHKLKQRIG
jgi:hypothetical protein